MKAKVYYDDDKKTLYAALAGPLSPREQAEFFIKAALVLSGHRKRQLVLFFGESQSSFSVPRNLVVLFKGLGKLGLEKIALIGIPLPARGIVHGVIESAQCPSRKMQHEFFASENEAFLWLGSNDRRSRVIPPPPPASKKEVKGLVNIAPCKNETGDGLPDSKTAATFLPDKDEALTKHSSEKEGIDNQKHFSNLDGGLRLALKKPHPGITGDDDV